MVASWYGEEFHGRRTASGELYNMYALTAAHKSLPLGTILKVTHRRNGKSVQVTINDRGPFIKGRDLDLSYAAALRLDCIIEGVVPVSVEWIAHDNHYNHYLTALKINPAPSVRHVPANPTPSSPVSAPN